MTDTTTRTGSRTYRGPAEVPARRGSAALPGVASGEADAAGRPRDRAVRHRRPSARRVRASRSRCTAAPGTPPTGSWSCPTAPGRSGCASRPAQDAPVPPPVPDELTELVRGAARSACGAAGGPGADRAQRHAPARRGRRRAGARSCTTRSRSPRSGGPPRCSRGRSSRSRRPAPPTTRCWRAWSGGWSRPGCARPRPRPRASWTGCCAPARGPRPRRAGKRGSAGAVLVEYLATQVDRLGARGAPGPSRRARRRAPAPRGVPQAAQRVAGLPAAAGP